jgi:PPM family protein phosphatase
MSEQGTGSPVRAFGYTDVGQRSHNEDSYLVNEDIGLMLVADGVGGHHGGEVASDITCKVMEREMSAGSTLEQSIKVANVEVFEAVAQELGRAGMASTVVAVAFDGPAWVLAWVGDSRAYLWDGQLGLLSRDHSLVESLVQGGQITIEEARSHPKKNVIEQAVGLQGEDNLKIGSNYGVLQPGQVLVLCSDGLNDVLDSASIVEIITSEGSLQERGERLVQSSIDNGGRDNSTVVIIELVEGQTGDAEAREPHFVWRYDPVAKTYSGLPELKPKQQRRPARRVAPSAAPEGTVMLKSPVAPPTAALEAKAGQRKKRKQTYLWMGVAVAALVLIAGGLLMAGLI